MDEKPKILCLDDQPADLAGAWGASCELVHVGDPLDALSRLAEEHFAGFYVGPEHFHDALRVGGLLRIERILEGMPDGVALIDSDNTIAWANQRMQRWCQRGDLAGDNFYEVLGSPEILGPDFCPFHTALATGQPSNSTLRRSDNTYYQLHAAPVEKGDKPSDHLIVSVRDVTLEMHQQQKLEAIHRAGIELADLTPDEIFQMNVEDRIDLLKSNILHHVNDLLNFDVIEIRLLDQRRGELMPLLSVGITSDASQRALFARPTGNGVTGFVAATGKSYLCEDTTEDPLYIEGFKGAKSSLTVPLILHDEVIGSFNVESPEPRAFTESDLQFLEIYARDLAYALNTLELLVAQQANAAQQSCEAIHSAVALPVDEILNDAVNVMECYIGHETDVVDRLRRILKNARDIKQVIHQIGQEFTPAEALPEGTAVERRPKVRGTRVLVVDDDESVRNDAHNLLERYGCSVETAHNAGEATYMVRNIGAYDCVIADIRLPDMSGYQLMLRLLELMNPLPLILMTGFGYDPGHSIVKARQAGLHPKAILYKPFRLDQLLETVETVLDAARHPEGPNTPPANPPAGPEQ